MPSLDLRVRTPIRLATLLCVLAAAPALAQSTPQRIYELRIGVPAPHYGERPVAALSPALQQRLGRVVVLRESGRIGAARDSLTRLLAIAPHHPILLVEMARLHQAARAWRAMETLARSERALARDSLLLAEELAVALERQGRAREAAQAVFEAWVAKPQEEEWALGWLDSLAAREPRGVRELARRTAAAFPARDDLARAAARLEWHHGDPAFAMKLLATADVGTAETSPRWRFAEDMMASGTSRDSAAAVEALLDLAGDHAYDPGIRVSAARRAWDVASRQVVTVRTAPKVAHALRDLPADRWGRDLIVAVMQGLREGGLTAESRELLNALGDAGQAIPEIALERALTDLREGPPEKALPSLRSLAGTVPEAGFLYAEALFFSGQPDSAAAWYGRAIADPSAKFTGAALERIYQIEDGGPRQGLIEFGHLAYEQWRGEPRRALTLADSLFRSLPHGPLWAQAALALAALREATGDGPNALEPLLAVADGLPDDRLAPLARQRAGDVFRIWRHDDARALEQYEECLARYPKAWNTPEVRRWVEVLRRDRRF